MSVTWARYGKKRLYVNDAAGVQVGWVDLLTGERHVTDQSRADEFARFVDGGADNAPDGDAPPADPAAAGAGAPVPRPRGRHGRPDPESDAAGTPVAAAQPASAPTFPAAPAGSPLTLTVPTLGPAALPDSPAWTDLALNRPGQGIRAKAREERAAQDEAGRVRGLLQRVLDVNTDERAYRVGAEGEEAVGPRLERLVKHGWRVLHSVPVGVDDADVDHVLIGPGGVFTVNTKNHPGGKVWVSRNTLKVNGYATSYLHKSRHEATRSARLLTAAVGQAVTVNPVLIILTGTLIPNVTVKEQPDGVWVLDRTDVPGAFKRRQPTLTPEQVEAIFEHARRSTTWVEAAAPRPPRQRQRTR